MKKWPIYFKDKLIIGNTDSNIGIVTLWTPVNKILKNVDNNLFSLAGQLYSKEGVNFIIRNILANPKINKLYILGEERTDSGKVLASFLDKGIDKNYQVKGAEGCQIHKEIPKKTIRKFIKNVEAVKLSNKTELKKEKLKNKKAKKWAKPQKFKEAKVEFDGVMPNENTVFPIREKYIGEGWLKIIEKIIKFGTIRESFHGNNCKELFNITTTITKEDPDNFKVFDFFPINKKDIKNYIPKIMTGKKGSADYTYGERLWNFPKIKGKKYKYNQVDEVVVDYLSRYPTDRAACAAIFSISDHSAESAPCMTFLQAVRVDEKLDLTAYFRSHDIFDGWLLNAFGLRVLQKYIAKKLKWPIGNLTIISNCAHIYDNNWKRAQNLIKEEGKKLSCTPDPRGSLVISTKKKDVIIKHISCNGKPLQTFKQNMTEKKGVMKMYNKLVKNDVVSQISHAFDIGAEIQKAKIAIDKGLDYNQDQELKLEK